MLRQANMVKRITASGGGDLQAQSGESLRVRRIECVASTNDTYLTVSIDRVTVGFYRVQGKSGNHLGTHVSGQLRHNIMQFLTDKGIDVSIPIAEGQKLTVSRYAEEGNVMLIYDRYDAGDVKATDPNGSDASVYTFLQYAKVGTAPTADGDALIDTSLSPAEFPDFPCGKVVPANHVIELLGVAGSPFVDASEAGVYFATTFMKFVKDREVLFDIDRNGIPFDGQNAAATELAYVSNFSLIGPNTSVDVSATSWLHGDALIFDPALVFESGQELNVYLTVVKGGAATWTDNVDDQAFILRVHKG